MKKFIRVILTVATLCCSLTFGAYANGTMDSGLLDFNGVTDTAGIQAVFQGTGYMAQEVFVNAKSDNTIKLIDSEAEFGKSIAINNEGYAGLCIMALGDSGMVKDNLAVEFSIKKSNTATTFGCNLENTKNGKAAHPFLLRNGNIQLCGEDVAAYDTNTWYDVKLELNPVKDYAVLNLKKHSDDSWNTYVKFGFNNLWTGSKIDMSAGFNKTELGYLGADAETTCVDNIRYYTKEAGEITVLKDDFSEVPEIVADNPYVTDAAKQWRMYNKNKCTSITTKEVDGKQVLAIAAPAGAQYITIGKLIKDLDLPEDATSVVKFGLGRNSEKAKFSFMVNEGAQGYVILFMEDAPKLDGGASKVDYYGAETGKIHDFEFVYNKKQGISRVLTPANGRYYGDDVGVDLTGSVDFQLASTSEDAEVYLSDFSYNVVPDNKCTLKKAYPKSGYDANSAALDDEIIFEFNQPVVQPRNTDGIECIIKDSEGNVLTKEDGKPLGFATFSRTEPNKVTVTPQEVLKPNTKYTVELPNIQGGYDSEATAVSYEFTTADFKYEFGAPVIENGTIKVSGKSAYVNPGKKAMIIAAAYDESGKLTGIDSKEITASKAEGETFEFTPGFGAEYAAMKAFVWNGFESITPYAKN